VEALAGREAFRFTALGRDDELEAAITPGMPSFVHTRAGLREFAEKTIRWPGHWAAIDLLKEAHMLDEAPLRIGEQEIAPRAFLAAVLEPHLRPLPGDVDACVMWNSVSGVKDGAPLRIDTYMWDEADVRRGISAMARVTAYPAAVGALLLGRGMFSERGLLPPEDAFEGQVYRAFFAELEARGVHIEERVSAR
jgi:saccharopine dehydrogenase-like NADP-dependent oxidoreductase